MEKNTTDRNDIVFDTMVDVVSLEVVVSEHLKIIQDNVKCVENDQFMAMNNALVDVNKDNPIMSARTNAIIKAVLDYREGKVDNIQKAYSENLQNLQNVGYWQGKVSEENIARGRKPSAKSYGNNKTTYIQDENDTIWSSTTPRESSVLCSDEKQQAKARGCGMFRDCFGRERS